MQGFIQRFEYRLVLLDRKKERLMIRLLNISIGLILGLMMGGTVLAIIG